MEGIQSKGPKIWFKKIGEFEQLKFEKSGVIYKGFLRPRKKFKKLRNSNNRMFEKSGFNCSLF